MTVSVAEALACLENNADFRILRRLDPEAVGGPPLTAGNIRRAAIVDSETTGMDAQTDQVLEIGILLFEYVPETAEVGPVVGRLSALEDPGRPIPPESTAVHGITDSMVKDQRFDDAAVSRLLAEASLVIAHNAQFDRPFLEARFPVFKDLNWACSLRDIPWREAGNASSALEFLAYRAGFFYEGHRAEMDCRALLAVLNRPFGTAGDSALKVLLNHARQPTLTLWALDSPFDKKELLKARGYRWNAERKVWGLQLPAAARDAEQSWLKANVYGGRGAQLELETLIARVRYSDRPGKREMVRL